MKLLKKIKKYINTTLLCIRFPFLIYKSDYVNNYIYNKQTEHRRKYDTLIPISVCNTKYIDEFIKYNKSYEETEYISHKMIKTCEYIKNNGSITISNNNVNISRDTTKIKLSVNGNNHIYDITSFFDKQNNDITYSDITYIYIIKKTRTNIFGNNSSGIENVELLLITDKIEIKNTQHLKCITVILDKKQKYYMKFYNMLNDILSIFYTIIDFSHYDDIPIGWRNKFGIQLCKEIKHSLLYTYINNENISKYDIFKYIKSYFKGIKLLYTFRLSQVKEKFGTLRIYTNYSTDEVNKIIDKYENISYNTCICCGKPAEYITTGWISPYCKDCITESQLSTARLIKQI